MKWGVLVLGLSLGGCAAPWWAAIGAAGLGYAASANNLGTEILRIEEDRRLERETFDE